MANKDKPEVGTNPQVLVIPDVSYCSCVIPHYVIVTVEPLPNICDYCRKVKKEL